MSTAGDKERMKSTLVTSPDQRNSTTAFGYRRIGQVEVRFGFFSSVLYLCTYCGLLTLTEPIDDADADSLVLHAEHCMGTTLGVRVAKALAALDPQETP